MRHLSISELTLASNSILIGKEGKTFGSISPSKICETLETEHKIKIDKRKFNNNDTFNKIYTTK